MKKPILVLKRFGSDKEDVIVPIEHDMLKRIQAKCAAENITMDELCERALTNLLEDIDENPDNNPKQQQ